MSRKSDKPTCTDAEALERSAERGWLFPYLLGCHALGAAQQMQDVNELPQELYIPPGRWPYWLWIVENNALPPEPIPQIRFQGTPAPADAKHVEQVLGFAVARHGTWYDRAWLDLTYWLLHGFGRRDMEEYVARIPADVRAHWYREFDLSRLLHSPCDWPAFVLQGGLRVDGREKSPWASSSGFFSTPIDLCQVIVAMTMTDAQPDPLDDPRLKSVLDPCCGTGSQLLAASNYSLRLFGQDIVYDLVLSCELNGWLWAPWMVYMPEATREMLERAHDTQVRFRTMRALLMNPSFDQQAPDGSATGPVGVAHTPDDARSVALAEERRKQAETMREAARKGELVQMEITT